MTDLNSSLTDFDKSLISETPKPPELKPFSVWSEENKLAESDPKSYVQYSDYMREDYLNQGAYTPNVEEEISSALNSKLADFDIVDEEDIEALTATKELSFEEKLEYVYSSINGDDKDFGTLSEYKAGASAAADGGATEEYQEKVAGLREQSEEVVSRRYDGVKRSLVESNQLPMAYVINEEGQRELMVGDGAENMTVSEAIKSSKMGGVSFKDAAAVQRLLTPLDGLDINLAKFKRIASVADSIAELEKNDASVAEHVTGHIRQIARKDKTTFDNVSATVSSMLSGALTFIGVESEENNDKKKRIERASRDSFDQTIEYITEKLNDSGANYRFEDVRSAYESHVFTQGANRGLFKLHQDPKDAGKNVYKTALGPVLNPAVFARAEDMANTLAASPDLTDRQKELFTSNRAAVVKQNFSSYSKLLSESAVGDEWAAELIAGRHAGREDIDIFDAFIAKDENFNEYADSAKGIAYSVWDSVASLLYIAPAVMGADWAKEGLADASQRQSDRREVAQIFGEQYGLFQDVSESIAPLIVDITATALLSTFTAGAGGAAYLTARGGAQLTAKGLAKSLTSNVLRASSKEGLESVAETAVAKGLIKESLEKGGRGKTIEALKAYNNEVAKKFGVLTGVFVPAATRSSAMTYGSLYNQLRKDPDLTEEQAHDRAMGFALTSGVITGIITAGFSAIGRGGVEDALLKGMTFRESKKLFQAMGNTGGISDANVAKAIKKVMGDSIKKYGGRTLGKKITKNVIDEGIEEGTDQLVNSFVEDVALNQDTPMLERMKQVWHAAQVGGILGGGVPAIQSVASRLKVTPMDQLQQRIRLQNDFADQVSSELESTGSPLAANQVREVLMTRARSRETTEVETPKSTSSESFVKEQNRSELVTIQEQMGEQASELEKLNDSSTLPEAEAERSAEVQRREERKVSLNEESAATLANFSEAEEVQKSLETGNPSEFTEGITDGEIAPETFIGSLSGATPLEVETAFENIRNQQNVSFAADEETTTLNMGDPTGATPINFTKEQENARASGATLTGESKINVALHNTTDLEVEPAAKSKRYSSRSGTGAISFSESPFSGGNAAEKANKLISFAVTNGFPAGLTHQVNYGLPMARAANRQSLSKSPEANYGLPMASGESRQYLSEFVASAVYAAYPKLAPPKNAKPYTSKQPTKTYFDPVSGKTVSQKVEGFIDDSGNGIFDNDPITMIDMLKSGKLVKVPRSFNRAGLNPSIRIKDGVVIDVVGPTADGNLIESKVNGASRVASVEPNNARAGHIARIPFKKAALPAGVKDFDFTNGGPLDVDFADTPNIERRIGRFSLELAKTGDDTNLQVQGRLKSDSGSLSPEFKAAALESASQDFLLNAQLFSLREKFLTNPDAILNDIVAQTGSRNIDEAAQILLPLVSVESNTEITSEGILGLFVEQKLQGNADFANNSPPTFDALLAKAANKFKAQEEMASSIRSQRAVSTLPFDVTSSEFKTAKVADWVANFGRNPEGQLASPEAIGGVVSSAITTSIEAVNTDPDLRRAINKITLDHILDDTTPEMADMVQTANARDIFGIFISWVSSGNGNTRESVTEFMKNLEDGVYPSSDKLKSALLLANFATHSDRNGYSDPDAVNEYRDLFNQETGQEINTDQARDTMIALTKAVRTHLSRSNISESERSSVTAQNELDVQRLGLESGNPASVIEALKVVSKNVDNPSHQVVADLLLLDTSFINSVKFLLGPSTGDIAGKYVKGLDGSHTVFINTTSGNGRGIVNTLLEEYVHAFVSDITSATPAQVANMPRGMKTRLAALNTVLSNARTAYAKQVKVSGPVPSLDNALVDLNEFFAQFLLSEDVQKHVKGLEAPANRSSFFSRFLTNMVMLFPKMNTSQVKSAVDALTDVLDVGSNTRKTTPTDPKVLGGSIAGKALSSAPVTPQRDVEEAQQMQQDLQQEIQQEIQQEKELKQQEQGDIKRQEDARLESEFLSSVPEADRPRMGRILNYVRGIVPFGMDIKVTTNTGGSSAYVTPDESTIFVNPVEMMKLATDVQDIAGKALIGVVINEELAHTASFSALTKEEIQGYIDSLSDSDFQDIAREYYTNTPDGSFLKTTLENLASEDPAIANLEKYKMAEEKLRMHLQKVTRGFTTEDDTQFWSSKPSLLRMLKRYLTGVINRWVYSRKQIGAAADVALNKMIIEMRAIEVGFVRQPTKMAFDTENPMDVFQMYGTVNQDFVGLASAPVEDAPAIEEPEAGSLLPNVLSETLNTDVGGSDISWGDDQRLMAAPASSPEAFPALDKALGDKIKSETKEIAVIQIDRMRVGDYNGTPLQGGMFYPTIDDNLKNRVAWAFNSKGAARDVLKRVRETGGYAQLVLMSQGNIVGNKTFSKIWFEEVERAVSSRKLTKKRVLEHLNEVRARKEDKTGHKKVWKTIKEAKEQIVNMPQMKRASNYMGKSKTTTVSRGEHMRYGHLLAKSAGEGFPDAEKLVEALEDPTFKGFEATTVVGIIKFDVQPDSAPILTGAEAGVPEHLSYKYVLKGEPVARLQKRVLLDEQYPETKNFLMTQAGLKTPVSGLYAAPTGQSSAAPTGTGIDFSAVVDLLEVPVYEIDMGKPKNFIARSLTEMFAGHIPEAFRRLIQNRDAYKRATETNVIAYKKEMDKLIVKTYGSYENAPMDMIARAQGYYSGNVVTEQALDAIEAAYNKVYAAAEKGRKDKTITRGEAKILKDKALLTREKEIDKAYGAAVKVREADRDAALRDLAKDSSALAAHIIDIRQKLIIPLQEKLVKSGLNKEIGIKISKTGGIYVTRSYRMFTDSSFLETVKTDPLYEAKREAAMAFFVKNYLAKTKTDHINAGMDPAPAEIEAKKDLDRENKLYPHSSYGQEALNTFFLQYKEGGRDSSTSMGPQDYKMIEDNLKQRKDLPEEIREILGEHGPETGIDLILKTYSTVANVAAQQAFLNQLKSYGKKGDVMVDSFTLNATEKSRKKYKDLGFVPARSGPPSKNDPLSGMYVSAEFKEALDVTLKDSFILANADTAERAVKGMFGLAANLSGKAMALKTLGSVGFYFRNAVGNFLFGSAQGYFRYDKMAMSMFKGSVDALFNPDKIDPVVSELIGLNVMRDELRAGVMRDLLNGKVTPEGITKQISELGEKTKLNKGTKALAFVEKKAQDLSAALDAAYKVVYYNHELGVLKEAQEYDPEGLGSKTDMEIKRMAARKVVMTSQAYSQAPPAVAAFTKTPLGLVAAPFIRFKMEVPRIVINTFKLAKEEIRSGNPVLISRGRWRRNSMIGMLAGASSALPMIMAALSGIGDEEDESLRASGPVYLRGHTFFYQGKGKDLKSWDLTYLNPFSLIVDPFLRAFENIRRGEYTEAGAAFAKGFVLDQYLDDQILAGAVKDATRNHNPATGKPIWTSGADGPVEAGVKLLSFVAKEAYAPRIGKDFFEGWATGSLSGMKDSLVSGALPVRRYDVDLSKQYSRYLLDLNKRYTNVKSNLNAVRRANPMSDGAVKDIIDDNIEDRRLLNYELMRINKGFKGLGLTDTDLLKGMKDMKLGRDRVALLSRGYMDRPSIKYTIERLLDPRNKEHGPARAQQIIDHYRTFNRYIPIRPITESE